MRAVLFREVPVFDDLAQKEKRARSVPTDDAGRQTLALRGLADDAQSERVWDGDVFRPTSASADVDVLAFCSFLGAVARRAAGEQSQTPTLRLVK